MKESKIFRRVLITTLLAILFYAVLLFFSDALKVISLIKTFNLWTFLILLALSLFCYLSRTVRLFYLMHNSGSKINFRETLYIQFSGMTMTITPGKVGEVFKAFLAKEIAGFPVGKGIALVFVERLTDLVAVLILSLGGLTAIKSGYFSIGIIFSLTTIIVLLFSTEWFQNIFLCLVRRSGYAVRFHSSLQEMFGTIKENLRLKPLLISVLLAVLGWGAEGVAFFITLKTLEFLNLDLFQAIAVYAISTIAGALAMFPGGIGLTEGSMMGILIASGATRDVSFSATMIIRFTTLWFGVISGWIVFFTFRKGTLKKILKE